MDHQLCSTGKTSKQCTGCRYSLAYDSEVSPVERQRIQHGVGTFLGSCVGSDEEISQRGGVITDG